MKLHKDTLDTSNESLKDWYEKCQPTGSGPTGIMRMLCALIEEIAEIKGFELTEPRGVKK